MDALDKKEVVRERFEQNIRQYLENDRRQNWRYYHVSKVKTDYYLISKVGLQDKVVLNVGGFYPIDEIFFAPVAKSFFSVDFAPQVIESAKEIVKCELPEHIAKKIHFSVADAANLPFKDNSFDISMSFSTLEHIPDEKQRQEAFREMARVTKRGGCVIITVPNKLNFLAYRRSSRLQNQGDCPYGYEGWYTPSELKRILIQNGLQPVYFASSAGDYSELPLQVSRIYSFIVRRFGLRMGWLGKKV